LFCTPEDAAPVAKAAVIAIISIRFCVAIDVSANVRLKSNLYQ